MSVRNRTDGALRQNSSYVYDTAGRLKSSVTSFPFTVGKPYSNSFTYSASNGLLTSVTATNTDTLTPTYNGLKQVTSVKIDHNDKPFCKNYSYVEVSSGRTSSLPDKLEYTASDTTALYLRNTYGYDAGNRISTVMETADTGSPEVAGMPESIDGYDTVFVGFPIWWYVAPTIVNTFLEGLDLKGKTVVPFATSGGSGMGKTNERLCPSCPGAKLVEGKVWKASASADDLAAWAESVGE